MRIPVEIGAPFSRTAHILDILVLGQRGGGGAFRVLECRVYGSRTFFEVQLFGRTSNEPRSTTQNQLQQLIGLGFRAVQGFGHAIEDE